MYVIATFEHSFQLDIAINKLELHGITRDHMFIVPLVPKLGQKQLFDTIHRSDGIPLVNTPSIIATVLSVLGTIYGYLMPWGPIVWGVLGIAAGWAIGLLINIFVFKKRMQRKKLKGASSEVVIMIYCQNEQKDMITKNLYDHNAIGIGTVER